MAKMMRRNFKRNVYCDCVSCCDGIYGRAGEKREWMREQLSEDIWDARSCCTEKDGG